MRYKLLHGDCLIKMKEMADNSVEAIITDPPYGLSFMGKKWDYDVPSVEIWREALRVLKPGGHLLSFAGSRTYHRMAVNIEDAGFEIRDQIMWVYGSGFPKSYNVAKGIEGKLTTGSASWNNWKDLNGEKVDAGKGATSLHQKEAEQGNRPTDYGSNKSVILDATTPEAKQWEGWGTALKPAHEPIVVARKPLIGTIVENVLEHGTGGLNIDGCRIAPNGRFPANFIHDGSEEVVSLFPDSSTTGKRTQRSHSKEKKINDHAHAFQRQRSDQEYTDSGSSARFFYCAKAQKSEKGENNNHPTVKPVTLMKYLCRLITPSKGVVLDPFMGSGTTGIAATQEGFNFVGIEMDDEYIKIANHRISHWVEEKQELILEQRKQKTLFEW